jgi:hypothetical protein
VDASGDCAWWWWTYSGCGPSEPREHWDTGEKLPAGCSMLDGAETVTSDVDENWWCGEYCPADDACEGRKGWL